MRRFVVAVFATILLWAAPAGATNCREWGRASPADRSRIVDGMISSAISGNRGRQYEVNRGEIERCLKRSARDIEYDFDDTCNNRRSAGMQALNIIFKDYIWSCIS
jgi:hypothetical protein